MVVIQFFEDVPIWVWILLVFLLRRGFNALFDREIRLGRLFFLPVFFLVWGIYSVMHETYHPGLSLIVMVVGTLAGIAVGCWLWKSQPPLKKSDKPDLFSAPGRH